MLSDFPEEYWDEILAEGPIYDRDKGILTLSEKISVGFAPAADSLKTMNMLLENIASTLSTPSTCDRAFSMRPEHAAQDMPVTFSTFLSVFMLNAQ